VKAKSVVQRLVGVVGLTGVVVLAGCGHSHSVEDPSVAGQNQEKAGKNANDTPPSDRHRAHAARSETKSETKSEAADKQSAGSEIPVSTSPAGQLEEGAVKKIQDRLAAEDFIKEDQKSGQLDERTTEGLRKFQKSRDLAATGTPDQETVRKLGLDPKQIFRAAR
jgi:hypothetical protein